MRYLFVILALGFLLRVVALSNYPVGFSADEVNQGYTAYSVLHTGRDEWGKLLPIAPRSYGDYRAPLYTYLTIPLVAVFGLSEFAARLPNALVGTAAIAVVYFLVIELFGSKKLRISLLSSMLLAISPWHIMLSRGAFETNLPTLLFPLGILFFLKGLRNKKYMLASAFVFSLSLFAYYSSRMLFPITALILYICFVGFREVSPTAFVKKHVAALIILVVAGLATASTMFSGALTRVSDVSILSSASWQRLSEVRYEAVLLGLPDTLSRIFSNKATFVAESFVEKYLSYFSIEFLFTEGAGEATYGMVPGVGLLYWVELIAIVASLVYIIKNKFYKKRALKFILLMILIAPIPAALSTGPGRAANRAALMMPWIQILSAFGLYVLLFETKFKSLKYFLYTYFFLALVFFLESYFFHSPIQNSRSMSYGWREASTYLSQVDGLYDEIIVSRNFSEPQMFIAFYMKFDPNIVQKESPDWLRYESEGLKFVDQLGTYSLGKYTFTSINYSANYKRPNILMMGKPEDFPADIDPLYTVGYPEGSPAIYFVTSEKVYAKKL
jgi:4-amino-4-deoxy-L-arabinose transferase-like glycosyltransferase